MNAQFCALSATVIGNTLFARINRELFGTGINNCQQLLSNKALQNQSSLKMRYSLYRIASEKLLNFAKDLKKFGEFLNFLGFSKMFLRLFEFS